VRTRWLAVLLPVLCLPARAHADSIDAVATFNNIGVEVRLDTVPPPDAAVSVAIKEVGTSGGYREVHPLSRIAGDRFAGSVFRLKPGTQYSLRLSSAAFTADQFTTVATRADVFPSPTGDVYHVSPSGSDNNDGSSFGQAFKTVAKALAAAQAGDEIRLYDGRYHEGGLYAPRSGTPDRPIVIRNAPGARPVLDGTDTGFSPAWTVHDAANHVYRTPTTRTPRNAYVDGGHLFRYSNLADLTSNKYDAPGAYYTDGSQMYVRFPNDDPPAGHTVTIPRQTTGITLENKSHIQIRGIEFAYYGYGDFHRAVYIDGGDYNLIDRCDFHHNGIGVALKRAADFNTIQNSRFNESPVGDWSFEGVKNVAGDFEAGAVFVYSSSSVNQGNVIRNNVIENMFDGAHLYPYVDGATRNMDFHGNRLTRLVDDGLETDGLGSNNRIYGNSISGFLTGISVAPGGDGPTYIIRNVLTDWDSQPSDAFGYYEGYPFKFNVGHGSTNWVYLYHNTCYTDRPGQDGFLFKTYSDWENIISRNNIYAGTNYALWSWPDFDHPVDFDYDNLYTTDDWRFVKWADVWYPTLAEFYAATGHEGHGLSLDPGFVSPEQGRYDLLPESGMIDRAVAIPGVNDDYFGLAPDLGAEEYGAVHVFSTVPEPHVAPFVLLVLHRLARRRRRGLQ